MIEQLHTKPLAQQLQIQPHQDAVALEHALAQKIASYLNSTPIGVFRNCCTCIKFIEQMEICEEFNQRPPAKVIAYGCEKHSHNIPF